MPTYDISAHCTDCGIDHPVHLKIHIDDYLTCKQSVAEVFHSRSVPPQVKAIRSYNALCLKTGRKFSLDNDSEVFLVPPVPLVSLGNESITP